MFRRQNPSVCFVSSLRVSSTASPLAPPLLASPSQCLAASVGPFTRLSAVLRSQHRNYSQQEDWRSRVGGREAGGRRQGSPQSVNPDENFDEFERMQFSKQVEQAKVEGPDGWSDYVEPPNEISYVLHSFALDPRFNTVPMKHRHIGYAVEKALKAQPNSEVPCSIAAVMRALSDNVKELLGEEGLSLKQFAEMYPRKFYLRLHRDEKMGFEIMLAEVLNAQIKAAGGARGIERGLVKNIDVSFHQESKASAREMAMRIKRNFEDSFRPVLSVTDELHPVARTPNVRLLKLSDERLMQNHAESLQLTRRLRGIRPLLNTIVNVERTRDSPAGRKMASDPRDFYIRDASYQAQIASLEKMFSIDKEMIYLYAVPKNWRSLAMAGWESFEVTMSQWRLAMAEYNKSPVGPAPRPSITGPRPPPSRIPILEGMDVVDALKNLTINPASFHIYAGMTPFYEFIASDGFLMGGEFLAVDLHSKQRAVGEPSYHPHTLLVTGIPLVEPYDHHRVARYLPVTSFMPIGELIGRAGHVTQQSMLHVLLSAPHYFRFEKDESACGSGPKYNEKGELQPNFKYLKSVQFIVDPRYISPELKDGAEGVVEPIQSRLNRLSNSLFDVRWKRRGAIKMELTRLHNALHTQRNGFSPLLDLDVAAMAAYDTLYERVGTQRICLRPSRDDPLQLPKLLPPDMACIPWLSFRFFNAYPRLFRTFQINGYDYIQCIDDSNLKPTSKDVPAAAIETEADLILFVKETICRCQKYASLKGREEVYVAHCFTKMERTLQQRIKAQYGHLYDFFRKRGDHFEVIDRGDNDVNSAMVRIKGLDEQQRDAVRYEFIPSPKTKPRAKFTGPSGVPIP